MTKKIFGICVYGRNIGIELSEKRGGGLIEMHDIYPFVITIWQLFTLRTIRRQCILKSSIRVTSVTWFTQPNLTWRSIRKFVMKAWYTTAIWSRKTLKMAVVRLVKRIRRTRRSFHVIFVTLPPLSRPCWRSIRSIVIRDTNITVTSVISHSNECRI